MLISNSAGHTTDSLWTTPWRSAGSRMDSCKSCFGVVGWSPGLVLALCLAAFSTLSFSFFCMSSTIRDPNNWIAWKERQKLILPGPKVVCSHNLILSHTFLQMIRAKASHWVVETVGGSNCFNRDKHLSLTKLWPFSRQLLDNLIRCSSEAVDDQNSKFLCNGAKW